MFRWPRQFFVGVILVFRGMKIFFTRPRCWSYLIIPIILNTILYGVVTWLFIVYGWPRLLQILPGQPEKWWNDLWYYPMKIVIILVIIALFAAVYILTFTMVFFVVSAPFFDRMAVLIEREEYGLEFKLESKRHFISYCWSSFLSSILIWLAMLFWTILLLPLGFIIPYVGMIPFIIAISYCFALTFLVYSTEHRGLSLRQLRKRLKGKRMTVLGFGIVAYLALFIPFLAIPMLPIMVITGVILFNEVLDKTESES